MLPKNQFNARAIAQMLKSDQMALEDLTAEQRDHCALMKALVKKKHEAMAFVSDRLKDDLEFFEYVTQRIEPMLFEHFSLRLKNDKAVVKKLYRKYPPIASQIPEALLTDEVFFLELIKIDEFVYQFIEDDLKDSLAFNLKVLRQNLGSFIFIPIHVRKQKEVIDLLISKDIRYLWLNRICGVDHLGIRPLSFYRSLVRKDGTTLFFAHDYQDDEQLVELAIAQNGEAIQFASKRLRNRLDYALKAVQSNPKALAYLNDELKSNRQVVEIALKGNGSLLKYLPAHLRADYDLVKLAVEENGLAFEFASDRLRNNLEIAQIAMKRFKSVIEYVGPTVKAYLDAQQQ